MHAEEKISLSCPYCGVGIYQSLSWFKKEYSTCPACEKGLAAGQFAAVIADFEEAVDAGIEEMLMGKSGCGCGGGGCGGEKSSCA